MFQTTNQLGLSYRTCHFLLGSVFPVAELACQDIQIPHTHIIYIYTPSLYIYIYLSIQLFIHAKFCLMIVLWSTFPTNLWRILWLKGTPFVFQLEHILTRAETTNCGAAHHTATILQNGNIWGCWIWRFGIWSVQFSYCFCFQDESALFSHVQSNRRMLHAGR